MKEIKLTQGQFALVDDEDFDYLNQWKWKATLQRNTFYASRNISLGNGKYETIIMHRLIMGVSDRNIFIDHIDHNGINNQKNNLRLCSSRQNIYNTSSRRGSSSKYLGVSWKKSIKKWQVLIQKDGVCDYIGVFSNEKDAAIAYNKAAMDKFGEFANLNHV